MLVRIFFRDVRVGWDMVEETANNDERMPVAEMPKLGLGTYRNTDPEVCRRILETALPIGYRHVDTAAMYDNEAAIGAALGDLPVDREELFLATKVWHDMLGYEDVLRSAAASRDRLGVDTLDLLYVHWPTNTYDPDETLPAFEALYDRGEIDHIGVCNFLPSQLYAAADRIDAPIDAVQVECHPLLPQEAVREAAADLDARVVAYAPVGRGEFGDVPVLADVARDRDATVEQVCLAWLLAKGVTPIPMSSSERHLRENWAAQAIELDDDEVARIDAIEETRRLVDPDIGPWN